MYIKFGDRFLTEFADAPNLFTKRAMLLFSSPASSAFHSLLAGMPYSSWRCSTFLTDKYSGIVVSWINYDGSFQKGTSNLQFITLFMESYVRKCHESVIIYGHYIYFSTPLEYQFVTVFAILWINLGSICIK